MPIWVNSSSAVTPATISGTTSGISISTLVTGLSRLRARTRPKASSEPIVVATTIVTAAISRLATSDSRSCWSPKKSEYHWVLKPSKFCSETPELNEKRTTIAIGANVQRRKPATTQLQEPRPVEALATLPPALAGGG